MRLVFAGTPEVAVTSLDALLDSRHEVVAVLTRPDAPSGRGRTLVESPVGERARERGIDVLKPVSLRDGEVQQHLRELAPDCAPVVAYGGLVPAPALAIPRHGWVNLHFSLLPVWRGAAPVQRALWNGDEVTGACTFLLEEGLDTGPVLGSITEPIGESDTSGALLERLAVRGAALLVATLDAIEDGTAVAVPQSGESSLAAKLTVEEARLRWEDPADVIDRHARACTPAPGAWTTFRGERLGLGPVRPVDDASALPPGGLRILRNEVQVGTGSVPVRLGVVRAPGKREMPAADWARGARLTDADVLA